MVIKIVFRVQGLTSPALLPYPAGWIHTVSKCPNPDGAGK